LKLRYYSYSIMRLKPDWFLDSANQLMK
jgi:hypothetical protein